MYTQSLYYFSLSLSQRFYKKAAAFVLRAVAKHSPELAQSVVDSGALDALVICLEEFDPGVKESAAWALGYIARHNGGKLELNIYEIQCYQILDNFALDINLLRILLPIKAGSQCDARPCVVLIRETQTKAFSDFLAIRCKDPHRETQG